MSRRDILKQRLLQLVQTKLKSYGDFQLEIKLFTVQENSCSTITGSIRNYPYWTSRKNIVPPDLFIGLNLVNAMNFVL